MKVYRLYELDADLHIHHPAIQFELPADSEAVIKASDLLRERPEATGMEIWEGSRLVHRGLSA